MVWFDALKYILAFSMVSWFCLSCFVLPNFPFSRFSFFQFSFFSLILFLDQLPNFLIPQISSKVIKNCPLVPVNLCCHMKEKDDAYNHQPHYEDVSHHMISSSWVFSYKLFPCYQRLMHVMMTVVVVEVVGGTRMKCLVY